MLVDTDNLVSAEDFQRDFEKFARAAKKGKGPIAITKNGKVLGYFVDPDYFEFSGASIRKLVESRMNEPTVSQKEAEKYVIDRMAKRRKQ